MTEPAAGNPNAKIFMGCGGCGCAFGLLLFLVGVVLVVFGLQPRTDEALPFGIGVLVLASLDSFISLPLLIYGFMQKSPPSPPAPPPG